MAPRTLLAERDPWVVPPATLPRPR
jgi:hypothetical protein